MIRSPSRRLRGPPGSSGSASIRARDSCMSILGPRGNGASGSRSGITGIVRGKFSILEMAWIRLIRSEKTVRYQWWRNSDFVCGQVINFPLTVPVKLLGQRLAARDFDRQVAEFQVRVAVLNGFTALGGPMTKAMCCGRPGKGSVRQSANLRSKTMRITGREELVAP